MFRNAISFRAGSRYFCCGEFNLLSGESATHERQSCEGIGEKGIPRCPAARESRLRRPRDSIYRNKKKNESPLTGYVAFADSLLAPNSHQMAYATNGIFLLEYMHDS